MERFCTGKWKLTMILHTRNRKHVGYPTKHVGNCPPTSTKLASVNDHEIMYVAQSSYVYLTVNGTYQDETRVGRQTKRLINGKRCLKKNSKRCTAQCR